MFMRKILFAAAFALASLGSAPALAQSAQSGPFIGQLILVSFNFCPQGWHAADGALLSIPQNTALFSLIGTTFGGNGTTNFALPNVPPPVKGLLYCINLQTGYPLKSPKAVGGMMGSKPHH